MDRDHDERTNENDIDRLVRRAFGMDDDQLLRDFLLAQTEIKDNQIPPEPEDGFKRLLEKIEERGVQPHYAEEDMAESYSGRPSHKPFRLRPIFKVALAVGVIAALLMGMGITAGAKRNYQYTMREEIGHRNKIAINNVDAVVVEDALNNVYQDIYIKTGMRVLKLGYIPRNMVYVKTAINDSRATMYFDYGENIFSVVQQIKTGDTVGRDVSDMKTKDFVYNQWLKKDVVFEKATTENNEVELCSYIVNGDTYYQLSGIMEEEEFKKILKEVYIEH